MTGAQIYGLHLARY